MSSERTGRPFRAAAALALLLIFGTFNRQEVSGRPRLEHDTLIRFERVPLDPSAPGRRQLGALTYLDGWALSSTNRQVGGISAMHIDGGTVTALNDGGIIIRFAIPAGAGGSMPGRIDPLDDGPGAPTKKEAHDTESLAVAGDRAWVGYERRNIIARYRVEGWRRDAFVKPAAMRRWPHNGGSEGLVRLRDGRFLVFSERARRSDGTTQLLLFNGDPEAPGSPPVVLGYRAPVGYAATDAAELPDGRLLILNRRLSFLGAFSAKLVIARLPSAGDVMAGAEIAAFLPPITPDNMEALSITREGGQTIVWIASDDNFSPPLQRTLLLKFALAG